MVPRDIDQHYVNNEAGPGGWYPLGASQTWHNGIHLTYPRDRVVRAIAPGRIVAARFARNDELDGYPFGSPGFVLVKHQAGTFPAAPVHAEGVNGRSSLRRVTAEIPYTHEVEGSEKGHLRVGSIIEIAEDPASGGKAASSNDTMSFSVKDLSLKVRAPDLDEDELVWIREDEALSRVESVAGATTLMKIATSEDKGGLNCRARTDFGDNVLGVIPKGTKIEVYDQKIHAHGDVWQAVRAPDQDIPFGWIVTSKGRVRPANQDTETTTEFYSLYMNVAWEAPGRTQEVVPWMLPYYQHIFDEKLEVSFWDGELMLTESAEYRLEVDGEPAGTLHQNRVVAPTGREPVAVKGKLWRQVGITAEVTFWVPEDVLTPFPSAEADVGRIMTAEDQGGLNVRSYTDFDDNVLGMLPKGDIVLLSQEVESDENGWTWRQAFSVTQRWGGWVAAEKSGETPNVAVPEAFEKRAKKLKKGKCVKLDIPVSVGDPIANVGLLHPAGLSESIRDDQYGVHLEIFTAENFFNEKHMEAGGWRLVEDDSDKDIIWKDQTIQQAAEQLDKGDPARPLLEKLGAGGSEAATQMDVKEMREAIREKIPALRRVITRNTSYWAVDWQKVKSKNKAWAREFDFDEEDAKVAQKYAWWQECVDKDVPLPDKPFVYHYHPVAFLEYLDDQLPVPEDAQSGATTASPQELRRKYHTMEDKGDGRRTTVFLQEASAPGALIDRDKIDVRARYGASTVSSRIEPIRREIRETPSEFGGFEAMLRSYDSEIPAATGEDWKEQFIEKDKWVYIFRKEEGGTRWKLHQELQAEGGDVTFKAVPWRSPLRKWNDLRRSYPREVGDGGTGVSIDPENYSYVFVLSRIPLPYVRIKHYCDHPDLLRRRGLHVPVGAQPNEDTDAEDPVYHRFSMTLVDYEHFANAFAKKYRSAVDQWEKARKDEKEAKKRLLAEMVWSLNLHRISRKGSGFDINRSELFKYREKQNKELTNIQHTLENAQIFCFRWLRSVGFRQTVLDYADTQKDPALSDEKRADRRKEILRTAGKLHEGFRYSEEGRKYMAALSTDDSGWLYRFIAGDLFQVVRKGVAATEEWSSSLSEFLEGQIHDLQGELNAEKLRVFVRDVRVLIGRIEKRIEVRFDANSLQVRETQRGAFVEYRLREKLVTIESKWQGEPREELTALKRNTEEWKNEIDNLNKVAQWILLPIEICNFYCALSEVDQWETVDERLLNSVDVFGGACDVFEASGFLARRSLSEASFKVAKPAFHLAGIFGSACDYVIALSNEYQAAKEEKWGLAAANGVTALGIAMIGAAQFAHLASTLAVETVMGIAVSSSLPLGPVGAALVFTGTVLTFLLTESDLAEWMREECYWGEDFTHQEAMGALHFELQIEALQKILASPEVECDLGKVKTGREELSEGPVSGSGEISPEYDYIFRIRVRPALFFPEKSAFRIRSEVEFRYRERGKLEDICSLKIPNSGTTGKPFEIEGDKYEIISREDGRMNVVKKEEGEVKEMARLLDVPLQREHPYNYSIDVTLTLNAKKEEVKVEKHIENHIL